MTTEKTMHIETIELKYGAHRNREKGLCAMEAVAWLAGEPHSDSPQCTCPVIAAFVRRLNDRLATDEERTALLRPLLPILIGTRADSREVMQHRAYLAADWAMRTSVPMLLRALGREEWATRLESCAEVTDRATARAARGVAREVRDAVAVVADAADAVAVAAYAADAVAVAADAADAVADAAAYAADAADAAAYAYAADAAISESAAGLIRRMCEVTP